MSALIEPGKNCWRTERADRLRFLIDGEAYFRALRHALGQACRSIHILSWDIDSRLHLVRSGDSDGYPEELCDFLNALAEKKPELEIYILNWDFAMIYLPDREFLPVYKLDWKTHARLHFRMDSQHAAGASHHQKVVVIDDTVAFIGGLDLTRGRWDSCDHLPDDPKRDRIDGRICNPYHDVQLMLGGPVAAALGDLARQRWHNATGESLPRAPSRPLQELWPQEIPADMESVPTSLARTMAAWKGHAQVQEIEHLYRDAIAAAERLVYIENQYFTAPVVAEAIRSHLEREKGAEIVIVLPKATDGWLSQNTMDVLRVRRIRELQRHDRYNRLSVLYPDAPGLAETPINVHAKIMLVDDRIAVVGSANLNNRSMGLDSECNASIDAGDDAVFKRGIRQFRNRLLGEHLGCEPEHVADAAAKHSSLRKTIDALNDPAGRHLKPLPLDLPEEIDRLVPETEIVDPEHPIRPELMLPRILPEEEQQPARHRLRYWLLLIAGVCAVAALWQWSPLGEWVRQERITELIGGIRQIPAAPFWLILCFVLAGLVAFPFSLLIIASVAVFGTFAGFCYSLIGGMLSALSVYAIGELLGRNTIRKLAGPKLNRISRMLARHGLVTIIAVRIVPVAPFTVINLVAGASHINFRDYLLGTLLGMTPGMLALILVTDRVGATIRNPNAGNGIALGITATAVAAAGYLLIRWLRSRVGKDDARN